MLSLKIICIGKLKEPHFSAAVSEYQKRLCRNCKFEIIEIPEVKLLHAPTDKEIIDTVDKEAVRILEKLDGTVFPMCIEGKLLDSVQFSDMLENTMQFPGKATFVIGSSHGLSQRIKKLGPQISLSKMTFPHELARVMLCEQIYRAFQIASNSKYHK